MKIALKNLSFIFVFNSCIFIMLIIGIQNSFNKSKVNLLLRETVNLPISFIIGTSFVSGSVFGGFISIKSKNKQD